MKIDGYELRMTSGCCPEQYDVYDEDQNQVGYIRLRSGDLTVECPDCCDELVYSAEPEGDGIFEGHEREYYLNMALLSIDYWCKRQCMNV